MASPHPEAWFASVDRWGSICSIVAFISTGFGFLREMLAPAAAVVPVVPVLAGQSRMLTLLFLGLLAAVGHGILWSLAETAFGWRFGAGGNGTLPEGWSAVVLSSTMTIPLIGVPLAYQAAMGVPIVPVRHLEAGAWILLTAALAHLFMYGSKSMQAAGLRRVIAPVRKKLNLPAAVSLEVIWALVHFSSIVLVYRAVIMLSSGGSRDVYQLILPPLLGAAVFFFGMITFIFLRYPDSLADRTWIQVRGVLAGVILSITLQGSMLM